MGPIGCPITSVKNYHHNPEERSSQDVAYLVVKSQMMIKKWSNNSACKQQKTKVTVTFHRQRPFHLKENWLDTVKTSSKVRSGKE